MKTIVLAGGRGTRMESITGGGNKHLLPLWGSTVIEQTTKDLKKDWCIVTTPRDVDAFSDLFPGVPIFRQLQPTGIVDAILSAKPWAYGEPVAVLLGDNLFSEALIPTPIEEGAKVTLAEGYAELTRFGVASLDNTGKVFSIIEKPEPGTLPPAPGGHQVITGYYVFDQTIWDRLYEVELSDRGEKEIVPVLQSYLDEGRLFPRAQLGNWTDIGFCPSSYTALIGVPENWSRGVTPPSR